MAKQLSPGELDELETGIRNLRDTLDVIADHGPGASPEMVWQTARLAARNADELLKVFK